MSRKPGANRDNIIFGEDFELDLRAYQLRQSGCVLKLEPTPMELLLFLIENRGELITRDQIVEKIWGKGVFLDTDNSINGAIRKIRQVLKDNPEQPRFVQTVSGKGYRFIASVIEPEANAQQGPNTSPTAVTLEPPASSRFGKRGKLTVGAGLTILALALGIYAFLPRTSKLTDKDTILLADFTNRTGEAVFDGTLRQALAVQLEQSPFLSVISEERTRRTLQLMGQPAGARLTPEIAQQVCARTASRAVLDGSITSLGSQYVLGLRARDCRSGEVLAEEQARVAQKEDVLNALDQMISKLRAKVGESFTTFKKSDTPLAEATTPSLEALKAYSAGWEALSSSGSAPAVPFFRHAIEIDAKFAMAYAALGRVYADTGESALSAEYTSKAYELSSRVSDYEKFFIAVSYDLQVTGNVEKAGQTCGLWAQAFPRAMLPHAFLSGAVYPALGKYQKSIEEGTIALDLDPDFSMGYFMLSSSDLALERIPEAQNILQRAFQRNLKSRELSVQKYLIAFWGDDKQEMERGMEEAQARSEFEDVISSSEALSLAYFGHLANARRMSDRALDLAQKSEHTGLAALYETQAALREAFFGNEVAAKQKALAALGLSKNRNVEYGAAVALALSGHYSRARALTNDLINRFPDDTTVRFSYAPTLRAILALKQSDPRKAIEVLQTATSYEFGTAPDILYDSGNFYAVYVRGLSYLSRHQSREARDEVQKILDHRGIVLNDPIGALAHVQLGRAYAISGDKVKARNAYQDFFALWKDADADIPILREAKAEYAKLQ